MTNDSAIWARRAIILLCSCLVLKPQASLAALESQLPSGMLTTQLTSDKSVYQVGEPIEVRISIRNSTGESFLVNALPPWALFRLVILDSKKQPVPNSGLQFGYRITTPKNVYKPHSAQPVGFDDPYSNNPQFVYWARISIWGYSIRSPGAYTIIAIPKFTATALAGPLSNQQFIVNEKSNDVRIEVVN